MFKASSVALWAAALAVAVLPAAALLTSVSPFSNRQQVPDLTIISGTLERCGQHFCVDGRQIAAWATPDESAEELGSIDLTITPEGIHIERWLGTQVVIEAISRDTSVEVFAINGISWHQLAQSAAEDPVAPADVSEEVPQTENRQATITGNDQAAGPITETGELNHCGDNFCLGERELYLGPWWYLVATSAAHDLDGDGAVGSLLEELRGRVGATVAVEIDPDSEPATVYTVDGHAWRSRTTPPPWAGGPSFGGGEEEDSDEEPPPVDDVMPETPPSDSP